MDTFSTQEGILNWATRTTDSWEKLRFLKRYLNTLTADEATQASVLILHVKRRKKKDEGPIGGQRFRSGSAVSVPTNVVSPAEPLPPLKWWTKWEEEGWQNVISLDVEMVSIRQKESKKCKQVAGTVAICGSNKVIIYKGRVRHEPGTFLVNKYTKQINGFTENSFTTPDAKPFHEIKKEVDAILKNKLCIFCAAGGDFDSLELLPREYDYFDLQQHFYFTEFNNVGIEVSMPHSLETMYQNLFNKKVNEGAHCPEKDAMATIEIFLEKYVLMKTENVDSKSNDDPFNYFVRAPKIKFSGN